VALLSQKKEQTRRRNVGLGTEKGLEEAGDLSAVVTSGRE